MPTSPAEKMRAQLEEWRKDLINLSRNNRLLYLRRRGGQSEDRGSGGRHLRILQPGAQTVYDRLGKGLVVRGTGRRENADGETRSLRENEVQFSVPDKGSLDSKLRNLDRIANQTFMDRGLWVLYLGFGVLEWEEIRVEGDDPEMVQSPLLLVPVTVRRPSVNDPFTIRRADEEQQFNPALIVKMAEDFDVEFDLPGGEDEIGPEDLFGSIATQVHHRDWRVLPEVVLSTFSFHKEPILRDLRVNEETISDNPAIRALVLGPEEGDSFEFNPVPETEIDSVVPPETTVTILDADASQRQAIAAVAAGRSFVMDGPPGTGKSQTIANMIADLLAKGKTVLFVSEKAAALEVVFNRLDRAGLAEFVLELHSHKATRKEVAKSLGKSLMTRIQPPAQIRTDQLEILKARRIELSGYVEALNVRREPLGQSLQQVLGRISPLQSLPQAPHPALGTRDLTVERWARLSAAADALGRVWGPVARSDEFLWRDLVPGTYDQGRRVEVTRALENASATLDVLLETSKAVADGFLMPRPIGPNGAERLLSVETHLLSRTYTLSAWLSEGDLDQIRARFQAAKSADGRASRIERELDGEVGAEWRRLPLTGSQPLQRINASIGGLGVGFTPSPNKTGKELLDIGASFLEAATVLESAAAAAAVVADSFGFALGDASLLRSVEFAELGTLVVSPHLPEAEWLDSLGLARTREAASRLRPLAANVRSRRNALTRLFNVDILGLDLEALCVRFETVYRSPLRWMLSDYWRDRASIRRCTRSGRVRRIEVARLRDALEWKEAKNHLANAATEYASQLGAHYFRSEDTNFESIDRALAVAERALVLAGSQIGTSGLVSQLAREGTPRADLVQACQAIKRGASAWSSIVESLKDCALRLEKEPLREATQLAAQAGELLTKLGHAVSEIEAIANRPASLDDVIRWLDARKEHSSIEGEFQSRDADDKEEFGPIWRKRQTDWALIDQALQWSESLCQLLNGPPLASIAERLATVQIHTPRLRDPLAEWARAVQDLVSYFEAGRAECLRAQNGESFAVAADFFECLLASIDDIGEWYAHTRALADLSTNGLAPAARFCVERKLPAAQVRGVLERATLEAWADDVLRTDPRLQTWRAVDRDAFVAEYRELDRKFVALCGRETIATCGAKRSMSFAGVASVIQREAQKQKRHMPIRDLLGQTRDVALALKPCFMMSPLSVSQFLPPDLAFDVVIFDEASQVRPADAINCIYRGRQLVIAGDQAQLPPTAFFERAGAEDDAFEEDAPDDFESVLDKCKGSGAFCSLPLRWHYRSQHEHLIAYSNYSFYDGRLLTFPGAISDAADLGVELILVKGIYRRGAQRDNPVEARAVAERVAFHAQHHPSCSMGVVAFSEAQASAIDYEIEKLGDKHAGIKRMRDEDRLKGLFVKNLETVQGDERDIIIFSVGYGPDEAGKFLMNFGPISKTGGQRRLNVAITRARRKVEIVTSVRAADFKGELATEGARHLKHYLEFAERRNERLAVLSIPTPDKGGDAESPFEAEVARVVRSWGYDVVPQVGCSEYRIDMAIRHPNTDRFILGVECDGAMYHSSRAARDRDRLREQVLRNLGWRLHRIWGPAWYRHRNEQEARLRRSIEEALAAGPPPPLQTPPEASVPEMKVVEVDPDRPPSWVRPYVPASIPRPQRGAGMHEGAAQEDLQRIVLAVVAAEGPVHRERILRRAREAWGIERAGNRIREAFEVALRSLKLRARLQIDGEFLQLCDQPVAVRTPSENDPQSQRSIDEMPPRELELAIKNLVADARWIERGALLAYVARLFGWERSGTQISMALGAALDRLVAGGEIASENGLLGQPVS